MQIIEQDQFNQQLFQMFQYLQQSFQQQKRRATDIKWMRVTAGQLFKFEQLKVFKQFRQKNEGFDQVKQQYKFTEYFIQIFLLNQTFQQFKYNTMANTSLVFTIIILFLVAVSNAMIDWPTTEVSSKNVAGFLKEFKISTDRPKDNQNFTFQAVFYLKKDIQWESLSVLNNLNLYATHQGWSKPMDPRNKKQFTSNSGSYKAGDNITVGFNYTFNISQQVTDGAIVVYLGNQDIEKQHFVCIYFNMPDNVQKGQEKIEAQNEQEKIDGQNDQKKIEVLKYIINKKNGIDIETS